MIPLQLSIEGLYSYQQRQTIDFTTLTEAGLFGIFGAVGSGKSSILEAISFALYGETERLNSKEKRAYNMMNLKSNRSFIEFDFQNHENRIFRAAREFKRNSKNFQDVKIPNVNFYEKIEETWMPLESSNAEKILGLSYANFKRTIIIPQGQFKEFLELGAKDRTDMMKEIFQLQKFDLRFKTTQLNAENQAKLNQLEGQLKGFEEVNEEVLSEKTKELENEETTFSNLQKNFKEKELAFNNLKILRDDFNSLQTAKAEFLKLKNLEESFINRQTKLSRFEKTEKAFRSILSEHQKIETEFSSIQAEFKSSSDIQKNLHDQLKSLRKTYLEIENDFKNLLPEQKQKLEDWSHIIDAKKLNDQIRSENKRIKKGRETVKNSRELETKIQEEKRKNKNLWEAAQSKKIDTALLFEIERWFSTKNQFETDIKAFKEDEKHFLAEVKIINESRNSFPKNWKLHFEDEEKQYNLSIQNEEEKRSQLMVSQKLVEFANHLHEGESCPLCGALEHPKLASENNVSAEINEAQSSLEKLNLKLEELRKQDREVEKLENLLSEKNNQISKLREKIEDKEEALHNHKKRFIWEGFSPDEEQQFNQVKEESLAIEKSIEEYKKVDDQLNTDLETQQGYTEKYEDAIKNIEDSIIKFTAQKDQAIAKVKTINQPEELLKSEIESLEYEKEIVEKSVLRIERNYEETRKNINELEVKFSGISGKVENLESQIKNLTIKKVNLNSQIVDSLKNHHFETVEEVVAILHNSIDIEQERAEIQKFNTNLAVAKSNFDQLEEKLKDKEFDPEQFEAETEAFNSEKINFEKHIGHLATLRSTLERIKTQFKEKKDLLKDFSTLQNRAENLRIMENLFKGAGFVQYISSIYLRQLCDHANVRFHRMTRNQLSLQINENNDFEIIDYLNEGKSRSVKTLSGGQSFQVSLSLALALAESVQSQSQSDKNFFFIDEGFGTQDQESVNVVFETLMNLQKENRIVGIISHVEELKEKIPIALNIVKDEERGSLIEVI